jgi:hypothetical protein
MFKNVSQQSLQVEVVVEDGTGRVAVVAAGVQFVGEDDAEHGDDGDAVVGVVVTDFWR